MKAKRNGIIEISRFIFAFFIVFYHNLFIVEIPIFSRANYFVDFFFLLIGFYLLKSFDKYDNENIAKGTLEMLFDRLKKIGIPLAIAYACNLVRCLLLEPIEIRAHYLWFIHIMFIMLIIYYIFYRLIKKNKKIFLLTMVIVFLISFIMRMFPLFYEFDELRGVSLISLGALLAELPKIKFKEEKNNKIVPIVLVIISFILIIVGLYFSSLSLNIKKIVEVISDLILFPAFIYFALMINFKSSTTDLLGISSDFIYIYQPVLVMFICIGYENRYILFGVLLLLTLATVTILSQRNKEKEITKENS